MASVVFDELLPMIESVPPWRFKVPVAFRPSRLFTLAPMLLSRARVPPLFTVKVPERAGDVVPVYQAPAPLKERVPPATVTVPVEPVAVFCAPVMFRVPVPILVSPDRHR